MDRTAERRLCFMPSILFLKKYRGAGLKLRCPMVLRPTSARIPLCQAMRKGGNGPINA